MLKLSPKRYHGEYPLRNYFQIGNKKVIGNSQDIHQRQMQLSWNDGCTVAAAHVDFSRVLTTSLPAFAVGADKVLAEGTGCVSKMGRSSSLQRQGSMPSCLVGSRWPQGLMLGPESFNSCNSNVSDVTANTLSRSEGSVKHTQRADTASSRGLPQETWKNSSSTPTKTSGRATTRARWAQSCWEGAAVLLDARLNWLTLHIFTESKLDSGQKRKEKSLSPMLNSSGIPVLSANLAKKIINTTSL